MRPHSVARPLLMTLDPNFFPPNPSPKKLFGFGMGELIARVCVCKLRNEECRSETLLMNLADECQFYPGSLQ